MKQALTTEPTALANTDAGTAYTLQNRHSKDPMFVQIADSVPTDSSGAFDVAPRRYGRASRTASQQIYVWSPRGGANVVYDESA